MKLKSAPVQLKADGGSDSGEFEAIVSVFNNVDSWGDVVRPGAFKDTIAEWKASPSTLPVLWSHRMDDPNFNIGEVLDIAELDGGAGNLPDWVNPFVKEHGGLWVKGRIDTGPDASPIAAQGLRLLKSRRVTQFSYAYDEIESGPAKSDGGSVWELRKLKLYEVSPTQIGANELTDLLVAKSRSRRGFKIGRKLSAETIMQLQQAVDILMDVLDDVEDSDPEDDPNDPNEPAEPGDSGKSGKAKGEEPGRVKPSNFSSESSRVLRGITRESILSGETN